METAPPLPIRQQSLDPLALPSPERLREIEQRQKERARELRLKRGKASPSEQANAAELIQKTYRGHRDRRALKGHGFDPSTRWLEAIKDANYATLTRPKSNAERFPDSHTSHHRVRKRWAQAGAVAKRAGSDDTSSSEDCNQTPETRELKRRQKWEREKYAKTMGLEYFLEMVDHKHRYGSNLRRYHDEWMKSSTTENFFYWLDFGEGKDLDLPDRPRERLDRELVRYLSREERKRYLVRIDESGRFVWEKNGRAITTSGEFRDSVEGIVSVRDETPTWREVSTGEKSEPGRHYWDDEDECSSIASSISTGSQEDSSKYANEEFHEAKGLSKVRHMNVDALMNHLLRKTTKKNTWIFVADTSFRLYIGIKQSGAFQHSSFLKGARVAAAGLIKVKGGQIRKLSPLSGHYAPPVRNFREFLKNLKREGADLSRLNVSRSYAVILGLEGYLRVKGKAKVVKQAGKEFLDPEEKRRRVEAEMDRSQSAAREREVLAEEGREQRRRSTSHRIMRRVGLEKEEGEGEGEERVERAERAERAELVRPKTVASGAPAEDRSKNGRNKDLLSEEGS